MKKLKKLIKSPVSIIILFAVAAALIVGGSIGGVRAALNGSEVYQSEIEVYNIGVVLNENNTPTQTLLSGIDEKTFKIGQSYDEVISVTNSGSIEEYVRVTITRYWEKDGSKLTTLAPGAIDLNLTSGSGWIVDESASTEERIVLYYTRPVAAGGTTSALSDVLTVNKDVSLGATQYKKDYQDTTFHLEAQVDGVQTHNAAHAIMSAWGRSVTISGDGTLSLD